MLIAQNQKHNAQAGFGHILALLLVVVVLAAVGGIGFKVLKKSSVSEQGPNSPASAVAAAMPDCTGQELLQQSPVMPDQISQIIPLGNLAPPGHVLPTYHMYYNYLHTTGSDSHSVKTTLYVPADMTVTLMMKMDNADRSPPYDAYRIDFAVCKQLTGYFILVQTLNDKLAAAMQPPYDRTQESDVGYGTISHNWFKDVHVELKAGEVLGYGGGSTGDPDGIDMALMDTRAPKPTVANPERWSSDALYYVCTLDYYPTKLSKQLYAKLGDYYGNSVAASSNPCGSAYPDVPGTAQGVWVTANSKGMWDTHSLAALVHSNFDPSRGAFSFGSNAQAAGITSSYVTYFAPAKSGTVNLDFNLVKPGPTIYCYQVTNQAGHKSGQPAILLQLGTSKLTVGAGSSATCGAGPWVFDKTIEYVR